MLNFAFTRSSNYKCSFAAEEMANTRSMTRKISKLSSFDNDGLALWSNLDHDLLLLIMMQVGLYDFISFSGVCKQWRSVAVSNWNKFMVTKQPVRLSISKRLNQQDFYLEDHNKRRNLKITTFYSNGRICIGLTCGYLIFYGKETHDFWLVNPFTGKKLHFPGFPFSVTSLPNYIRGILVFSPSMSSWVFVVSHNFSVSFCFIGKQGRWRYITTDMHILDLQFFKGKIYVINIFSQLLELKLNPKPKLTLQKMNNHPWTKMKVQAFISSGENLYVKDALGDEIEAFEVDFDEMKWVNSERTIGEYVVFVSKLKSDAAIKPDTWSNNSWTLYERLNYSQNYKNGRFSTRNMWYFPHDCLNDKDPDMKNGNILKD